MSRKIMVTRMIKAKNVTCMVADTTTGTVTEKNFVVNRYVKDADILKQIRKENETETEKIACIVSVTTIETLMGMTEDKFIENAEVLPPRKTDTKIEK